MEVTSDQRTEPAPEEETEAQTVASGRQSSSVPLRIRIPINAAVFDRFQYIWNDIIVHNIKEAISCLCMLFIEPILDPASLMDLSIGLLLLERVGSTLQPYEATFLATDPTKMMYTNNDASDTAATGGVANKMMMMTAEQLQKQQLPSQHDAMYNHANNFANGGAPAPLAFFGSPFVLFLSLAAMFIVVANSSSNSAIFAPLWFRILTHQSTTFIMYILVVLFCLESVLVVCILVLACHALLFPQYLEENMSILFVLSGLWTASLMASSLVRYNLYQSIGD